MIMAFVALLLIDAAILGNIGAILGAIIDPANMIDTSTGASATTSAPAPVSTGSATVSGTGAGTQAQYGVTPYLGNNPLPGYHGSTF